MPDLTTAKIVKEGETYIKALSNTEFRDLSPSDLVEILIKKGILKAEDIQ